MKVQNDSMGVTMQLPVDPSINQPRNVFVQKTITHSLIGIGVIKRCCSIHVIRNSLIILLAKQI